MLRFLLLLKALATVIGQILNIDGKTSKHRGHEKALHIVSHSVMPISTLRICQ
jgi:hypothetical protein